MSARPAGNPRTGHRCVFRRKPALGSLAQAGGAGRFHQQGPAMSGPLRWYDHNAENPPWIKALADVRIQATREGWCHAHVQAIVVAIDQYAEAALGNRSYFLNKPYGVGGGRSDNGP